MIEALAAIGGISTGVVTIALVVVALKALAAKDGQLADRTEALAQKERADGAVRERDDLVPQLAAERAKTGDLMLAKSVVESERNALAGEVARLKIKIAAALPVSDDGAAVVNDQLSAPILGDALEKP